MPKQGVVSIGLQVSYKESLDKMLNDFRATLKQVSNDAERIKWDSNMAKSFEAIQKRIDSVEADFKGMFDELNGQKLSTENFKAYQEEMSEHLGKIESDIKGITEQLGNLGNQEYVKGLGGQFDTLSKKVLGAYNQINSVMDIVKTFDGSDPKLVAKYDEAINKIKQLRQETSKANEENLRIASISDEDFGKEFQGNKSQLVRELKEYKRAFDSVVADIKAKEKELSLVSDSNPHSDVLKSELAVLKAEAQKTSETLLLLDAQLGKIGSSEGAGVKRVNLAFEFLSNEFSKEITAFVEDAEKYKAAYQEITTLQLKNGKIQVPVHIDDNGAKVLSSELEKIVIKLKEHAKKNPIIASVKLVMDDGSAKGRKKNADFDQQQKDGQKKPAADLSPSIAKAYREGAKIAEESVKAGMVEIQKAFKDVPVTFKPDTEAFKTELKSMINDSLKAIAEDTTGIKVNEELEKLVTNLKEVSTSLSGNESFKFGLDEDSIERITAAIRDMADMIQRAFGVASNDDIAAQWTTIESKFKGVAGEEGKLLKGNKEHKVAIQELAVEYKKYLDMGGKNDLSTLTAHKQTVKNIAAEYENLGKAAQEAAQKQEKAKKKPASTKISSEEKDAINAISRENKKLETQAGKTGTALDNEGKSAQSAAEKFRKLAKEKGAAVVANRELAKAAKETADALEREAKAKKSGAGKTNKSAVDEGTYESNALAWQKNIKQSLLDSGNYLEVYEGKLSRLESGTVRYTAFVRDSAEESEESWKKLTATISSTGEIQSTKLQDATEKQVLKIKKEKEDIAKMLEQMADEGAEPLRLNRAELERYRNDVKSVLRDLEKSKNATYTVDLGFDGKLSITRREISKTGAEAKAFTAIIDNVEDVFNNTSEGMVVSARKLKEALKSGFDSAKTSTSTKDLAASARKAFDVFKEKAVRDGNFDEIESDLENLRQQIASIKTSKDLVKFNQDLKDLGVTLKNVGKDNKLGKLFDGENRTFKDINEVRANIDSLFASMGKVNEKSIRITGTDKLTAEVKSANGEIRKMAVSLDSNGFARFVDKGIVEFGRLRSAAEGVFKGIKDMVRIYLSPQDFIRYFRQGFDAVREIDTAMTELIKVSDASPGDITAYFDDAVESAKELGSSVNEMIGATADWQRMGYNLPDSRELGEIAVLYKNVGDGIDVDTANESLVSTMQGFQLQAKDAMSVIDAFNEVSNNYAISSGGIGEALKRSAAAFNAANTDLNQAIALITAGNEIVQSPEKVGTMWQTVSARIRGTKTELEELGEATDDVLSTSKLQSLVKGYTGVDIMKDKDTYKDIYTIISEIGKEWKKLEDVERAALLEGLAGKKQSNTLAAVLNNYERLEKIYQTAENSMGSAQKEQDRYTQSLQYSLDQLTAHGEEFWSTFINKDDVKDFIDLINTLISGATKLVDTFGSIPSVAGILGGFAAIKNVGINMLVAYLSNFIVLNYRQYRVSIGYDSLDYIAYEIHKFKRRRNMRGKPLTSHYSPILWKLNRHSNNV